MFMHAGLAHLFFNMLGLLSFGPDCENQLGERKFLVFYLLMGLGASLLQLFFTTGAMIGASGAIYGLLLAFGMLFPNSLLYLYFAIPIRAKYAVLLFGLLELYAGAQNSGSDNVAHFAHLGGMVFGYFLIIYWKKKSFNHYHQNDNW